VTKQTVLILGCGKIGSLISCLLSSSNDYCVYIADIDLKQLQSTIDNYSLQNTTAVEMDASDEKQLLDLMSKTKFNAVISSLPYFCNDVVANTAAKTNTAYFDLTEDVEVTNHVKAISNDRDTPFVPQCGLAPGFISIAAESLIKNFDSLDSVKMRVGALPVNPNNALKYSLTWSTDGLINEYGNICYGIENKKITTLQPLEGYETITVDGLIYEAFNTSGGLGTLADTYKYKITTMNYKTIRYPGHCDQIKLLMNDLKLNDDRDTLKRILEKAVPKTKQDVVLIYVSVIGYKKEVLIEENYVQKVYPKEINGVVWSAIQITTAAGICSVVDIVLHDINSYKGFVTQERFLLDDILKNRFGCYYS
jgi:saccharopine dehydrogenase-like NADP-dependent oxidoreductase